MQTRRSLEPSPPAFPVAVAFALYLPARVCCTAPQTPTPTTISPLRLLKSPDFRSPFSFAHLVSISWSIYCNNLVQHHSGHTKTQYPYGLRLGFPVGHREPSYSTSTSVPSHPIPSYPILSRPILSCPILSCPALSRDYSLAFRRPSLNPKQIPRPRQRHVPVCRLERQPNQIYSPP